MLYCVRGVCVCRYVFGANVNNAGEYVEVVVDMH